MTGTSPAAGGANAVGGFADPALDAQATFRRVLDGMAHPGRIVVLPDHLPAPPAPMHRAVFALALALIDFETPVWLDPHLAVPAVIDALRFHCNCPLVGEPATAAFALIGDPVAAPPLASFHQGEPEYPDRSTTVLFQVADLRTESGVRLTGPGIETEARLAIAGLDGRFWQQVAANHRRFPQGVDLLFATDNRVAALPRSTRPGV